MEAREAALRAEREEGREGTPQASMLQQDGGPIGGVCRLHTAMFHWPLSSEGGPGPRYIMKEVPGSSTMTMLVVHGYHLYLMPLFSEAGDHKTSSVGLPPTPDQPGQGPLPPPSGTYSTPCKDEDRGQARWKSHFGL